MAFPLPASALNVLPSLYTQPIFSIWFKGQSFQMPPPGGAGASWVLWARGAHFSPQLDVFREEGRQREAADR